MLSSINNTCTPQVNFTSNPLTQHKAAMFQKFFSSNPQFNELKSVLTLNKLPLFKNLCFFDVLRFKKQFLGDLFSDGIRVFFSTIEGKKPAGLICSDGCMRYLNRIAYPSKMDLIHLTPVREGLFEKRYNTYILNKEEVLKLIEQNKEIYVNRLGLSQENSTEYIYRILKRALKEGVNRKGENIDDIVGITLGFPKQNSMIFHLEKCAGIDCELRGNLPEYKAKLLEFFKDEKFPYKNLSTKKISELRASIESIEEIKPFHNAIYDFVQFVDEPKEMKRIIQASENYVKGFSLDTIA